MNQENVKHMLIIMKEDFFCVSRLFSLQLDLHKKLSLSKSKKHKKVDLGIKISFLRLKL